eukprot:scaffold241_cov242-Pinguiococcus_pyrenoidosus.AAC.36
MPGGGRKAADRAAKGELCGLFCSPPLRLVQFESERAAAPPPPRIFDAAPQTLPARKSLVTSGPCAPGQHLRWAPQLSRPRLSALRQGRGGHHPLGAAYQDISRVWRWLYFSGVWPRIDSGSSLIGRSFGARPWPRRRKFRLGSIPASPLARCTAPSVLQPCWPPADRSGVFHLDPGRADQQRTLRPDLLPGRFPPFPLQICAPRHAAADADLPDQSLPGFFETNQEMADQS